MIHLPGDNKRCKLFGTKISRVGNQNEGGPLVSGESYTIKELSRISGYSINTIRGYIKSTKIKANLVNGKYQIDQAEAERFFKVGNQAKSTGTTKIDTNLVTELRDRIHQLESDKAFLQKQILDLQETIKMLTIRKLPGYQEDTRGVLTKVKEWFVGKKEDR